MVLQSVPLLNNFNLVGKKVRKDGWQGHWDDRHLEEKPSGLHGRVHSRMSDIELRSVQDHGKKKAIGGRLSHFFAI